MWLREGKLVMTTSLVENKNAKLSANGPMDLHAKTILLSFRSYYILIYC